MNGFGRTLVSGISGQTKRNQEGQADDCWIDFYIEMKN
jgi:hypothetical protein